MELYLLSKKVIPCKPIKKIVDDNMVVGLITITNQFIPVKPERYDNKKKELEDVEVEFTSKIGNILNHDQNMIVNNKIDIEREMIIKKISLENNFYNLFRNTFKILINNNQNKSFRDQILHIVNDITQTYIKKNEMIEKIIKKILNNYIKFQKIDLNSLDDYNDLISCLGLNGKNCGENLHCFMRTESGICKLILPKRNLYNNNDNDKIYFTKLTDEIIRYIKIRKYLFTPRTFLSFEHVNYKINNNEIILLEEILLDQYLENIKLRKSNEFIKTTKIYELHNPAESIPYTSNYNMDDQKYKFMEENCLKIPPTILKAGIAVASIETAKP